MASNLRRTDDLQRLKVRDLVLQGTNGSYAPANSLLTVDGAGHVSAGATGYIVGLAAPDIYTTTIHPYPPGSTGATKVTGRFAVNNNDTIDPSDVTILELVQSDSGGTGAVEMYMVGSDSSGFGGDPNDRNQFCVYSYSKPNRSVITKVEATPLTTAMDGPAGLTGTLGDKYFYGNVQVGGYVAAQDGIFGSNVGIGVGSAVHALDVNGQVNISSATGTASQVFTSPGRYTIRIPANVASATVTLVGAGGGGPQGGYGGYIQGTLNAGAFAGKTLTVQVGGAGYPSTATFISDLTPASSSFIAMAGAGGVGTTIGSSSVLGGHGGGGGFSPNVSIGLNGAGGSAGYAGGGQGGQVGDGGAGGSGQTPGQAGSGRPGTETYVDVAGGLTVLAGGNGYTSGGGGGQSIFPGIDDVGAGGGGSSYINTSVLFTVTSYNGSQTAYNTAVPLGFGRSGQGGYVSISYTFLPSLYTSGDIVSGRGLQITAPTVPGSTGAAGSTGQIAWDTGYIYVCTGTNSWKRAALTTW